ncbi:MAG: hypothetical protein ACLUC0_17330 [Clostridium neonatale]|uniref:hypothetical protein n=1 Tax=Clostridium neonatale TaxID=137838 RepID=UPI00291BA21E|nr:hypothetical protein [Clostridium neonatale]CAI3565641.1 conserved hypothetical protein [Clostridium neonatale]
MDDNDRIKIIRFLQWNDRNGCYTDENCDFEEVPRMTYEEAVKYFFGVINDDFYYSIADNIFELTYDEVIKYAKENNIYESTMNKLQILINAKSADDELYRSILD